MNLGKLGAYSCSCSWRCPDKRWLVNVYDKGTYADQKETDRLIGVDF
jgi:hypothetical protein